MSDVRTTDPALAAQLIRAKLANSPDLSPEAKAATLRRAADYEATARYQDARKTQSA